MSNIVDRVFAEVCLDERITGGIFKLEEEAHMNALRDYFLKRGITHEAAVNVTNRMVEGRFPKRQAYNKDGILVTFPTPQHKAKAIQRGTHFEKNPAPQNTTPPKEAPKKDLAPKEIPPQSEPAPEKDVPSANKEDDENGGIVNKVFQGNAELEVEPPRGIETPEPLPIPKSPTPPPAPRTPERIAAEKEVAKQIIGTDDTKISPIAPQKLNEEKFQHQLNSIYQKCNEWGFREFQEFLRPHFKN